VNALVVIALLAAAPPALDGGAAPLLSGVISSAASSDPRFDVVTAEDLRRAIDVEAERRMAGCEDDASSCLAEVASALGASLVLHGDVGTLGDELVCNLNLFDSSNGTSGGRRTVRAANASSLASEVERATQQMLNAFLSLHAPPEGARVRLLVLDVKLRGDAAADAPAEDVGTPAPWLLVAAGATGLTGGAAVIVAVLLDGIATGSRREAQEPDVDQKAAQRLIDQSWGTGIPAIALYVAGPVLLVGAGALAALHFMDAE
jgi:hypothetical protein